MLSKVNCKFFSISSYIFKHYNKHSKTRGIQNYQLLESNSMLTIHIIIARVSKIFHQLKKSNKSLIKKSKYILHLNMQAFIFFLNNVYEVHLNFRSLV